MMSLQLLSHGFLTILLVLMPGLVHALPPSATRSETKCQLPGNDPYAPAVAVSEASSKFSGQCMDGQGFRAAKVLDDRASELHFANFIHDNKYWTARLKKDASQFDKVFYQVQRFPVVKGIEAAHVQLRVRLKPGAFIELESQAEPGVTARVNSFIASFEAGRPKGAEYNFALGAFDNYILVGRIASSEQRQLERMKTRTEQYELDLSSEEQLALALKAVERSARRDLNVFYNTLKPNCTTELLDLVDELPRLQGKFKPFLTLISADPIARPSLAALSERGLLKGRVQDMNVELKNAIGAPDQAQPMPSNSVSEIPYLPQVQGLPWTLVMTLPSLENLSADERAAILELRGQILQKSSLLLQALGSALMLGDVKEENASALLGQMIQKVQGEVAQSLKTVNSRLSPQMRTLGLYLVPFKVTPTNSVISLENLGMPAALPFSVVDAVVDIEDPRTQEIYYHIAVGTRQAADVGQKQPTQFFLQAVALKIQLQRDRSASTAQLMLGLKALKKDFTMKNSQVKFSEVQIPEARSRAFRSVMLISHRQEALAAPEVLMNIDFGAEGGIAGRLNQNRFGQFQLLGGSSCKVQEESIPSLVGVFGEAPLDNSIVNTLLRGKAVSFGIFGVRFNLRSQKIEDMNIKVATWPVSCLNVDKVNSQFKDEANSMLEKYKQESDLDGLMKKLMTNLIR